VKKTVRLGEHKTCSRPTCKHTTPRIIKMTVSGITHEEPVCRCCERKFTIGVNVYTPVCFIFHQKGGAECNDFAQLQSLGEGR